MARFNNNPGLPSLNADPNPILGGNLQISTYKIESNTAPGGGLHEAFWDATKFRVTANSATAGANLELLTSSNGKITASSPTGTGTMETNPGWTEIRSNNAGGIGYFRATGAVLEANSTSALAIPNGTTAQAPAGANGQMRYDSTTNKFRAYENGAWTNMIGGGGGSAVFPFQFSMPTSAQSTIGVLSKSNSTNANPGALPTTTSGIPGINNGSVDPYVAPRAMTINAAYLTVAHAAVSTATFTSPAVARFDVYRLDYSTRTLLGSLNFNLTSAGIYNNLGGNNFGKYAATGSPAIALSAGDTFGIEFKNVVGGNNLINSLGGIFLAVEAI